MWLEGLRVVTRMLVEEPFNGHEGKYLKVPVRNVVPKPLQRPHPPLWLACSRRETILLAAKLGLGALTFSFVSPEESRQWVNDYYTTLENECEPAGYASTRTSPSRARSCAIATRTKFARSRPSIRDFSLWPRDITRFSAIMSRVKPTSGRTSRTSR